jgi:hypothetical protein
MSQLEFFVVHFETLTDTQPHATLRAFDLHSLSYSLCGTGATIRSGGVNWPMIAEVYFELTKFLSGTAGLPRGQRG